MRSIQSIFIKQMQDTRKNPQILLQFILFPVMAFIMTMVIAKPEPDIPDNIYVIMFATMSAGMIPLITTSNAIAEDKERKSLRFLVMAGVKPHEYLLGVSGFVLLASLILFIVFGLIGSFTAVEFIIFISILFLGAVASALFGASIGIFSKNQQAATSLSTPAFCVLAFAPMLSMFNETIEKASRFLFTMQIALVTEDLTAGFLKPLLIIGANILVLLVFFVVAYMKKGLKG